MNGRPSESTTAACPANGQRRWRCWTSFSRCGASVNGRTTILDFNRPALAAPPGGLAGQVPVDVVQLLAPPPAPQQLAQDGMNPGVRVVVVGLQQFEPGDQHLPPAGRQPFL